MYSFKRTYFITSRVIRSKSAEVGFLTEIRRMNVGMTRARRKLLLVGDSSTLCRHPFFGELLAYVKGVGGYRSAHEVAKISSL
ncbi:AAA domain-containing protein [Limnohabitans sp. DCL3]|uniref:AAA domain-containing protein n=1 Tax=Limnohabitans sp. DCL3 TaxID=3374103 RepID=UPI003A85A2B1